MRPIVAISSQYDQDTKKFFLRDVYVAFLKHAGITPLIMPPTDNVELIEETLDLVDGVLIPGGDDIDPHLYGEEAISQCQKPTCVRDNGETALLRALDRRDMPVLGICRGLQMINVFYGGTLFQDLALQAESKLVHWQTDDYEHASHHIMPMPETPLAQLAGEAPIAVNSLHHQGICKLADVLEPMATASDGLIEAAYHPGKTFFWGVQWHPEFAAHETINVLLGSALCKAATTYHATKESRH